MGTMMGPQNTAEIGAMPAVNEKDTEDVQVEKPSHGLHLENMTPNQIAEAYHASLAEHRMTTREAVTLYRWALFWGAWVCFGGLMHSYGDLLTSSLYAFPEFNKTFGSPVYKKGKISSYQLSAAWQSGLSNAQAVGYIIGYFSNGWLVDRFGHRMTMIVACVTSLGFNCILFWGKNIAMLCAGETLLAIPYAIVHSLIPAYGLEVCPLAIRHWGPLYCHFMETAGHFVVTGILYHYTGSDSQWAWRIPFAVQWAWALFLIPGAFFAPESPWWCVRKGKHDRAYKSLTRLSIDTEARNEETLTLIQHTVELEKALQFRGSWLSLFKGVDLRRTEISCGIWTAQALDTFGLKSGTYFFEQAGLSASDSFALNLGHYGIVVVTTMIAIYCLHRMGRRPLLLFGTACGCVCKLITASLATAPNQTRSVIWPQAIFIMIQYGFSGLAYSTLPFLISTEVGSVRLRAKTLSVGLAASGLWGIVSNVVTPYMLNPGAGNLQGKACWVTFGAGLLILAWSFFRVPETWGRNSEEVDLLFAKRIPARQFKHYVISRDEEFGGRSGETME